jgi:hypothetical protein
MSLRWIQSSVPIMATSLRTPGSPDLALTVSETPSRQRFAHRARHRAGVMDLSRAGNHHHLEASYRDGTRAAEFRLLLPRLRS